MSKLKDILNEVETLLQDDQEIRKSITNATEQLNTKVNAAMQVRTHPHNNLKPVISNKISFISTRDPLTIFQIMKRIHRENQYEDTIKNAKENMKILPDLYENVRKLVPKGAFYKYHDIWKPSTVKVNNVTYELSNKSSKPKIIYYFSVV